MGDSFGQTRTTRTDSTSTTNNIVNTTNLNASGNSGLTALGTSLRDLMFDASTTDNSVSDSNNALNSNNATAIDYYQTSDNRDESSYSSDSHNVTTDFGAIKYGQGLSERAFDSVNDIGNHALAVSDANTSRAFDAAEAFSSNSEKFAQALTSQVIGFVANEAQMGAQTLGNTVSAFNQIAKEQNSSTDQKIADIAASSQAASSNTVKYVIVGVVAAGALYLLSRQKRAA